MSHIWWVIYDKYGRVVRSGRGEPPPGLFPSWDEIERSAVKPTKLVSFERETMYAGALARRYARMLTNEPDWLRLARGRFFASLFPMKKMRGFVLRQAQGGTIYVPLAFFVPARPHEVDWALIDFLRRVYVMNRAPAPVVYQNERLEKFVRDVLVEGRDRRLYIEIPGLLMFGDVLDTVVRPFIATGEETRLPITLALLEKIAFIHPIIVDAAPDYGEYRGYRLVVAVDPAEMVVVGDAGKGARVMLGRFDEEGGDHAPEGEEGRSVLAVGAMLRYRKDAEYSGVLFNTGRIYRPRMWSSTSFAEFMLIGLLEHFNGTASPLALLSAVQSVETLVPRPAYPLVLMPLVDVGGEVKVSEVLSETGKTVEGADPETRLPAPRLRVVPATGVAKTLGFDLEHVLAWILATPGPVPAELLERVLRDRHAMVFWQEGVLTKLYARVIASVLLSAFYYFGDRIETPDIEEKMIKMTNIVAAMTWALAGGGAVGEDFGVMVPSVGNVVEEELHRLLRGAGEGVDPELVERLRELVARLAPLGLAGLSVPDVLAPIAAEVSASAGEPVHRFFYFVYGVSIIADAIELGLKLALRPLSFLAMSEAGEEGALASLIAGNEMVARGVLGGEYTAVRALLLARRGEMEEALRLAQELPEPARSGVMLGIVALGTLRSVAGNVLVDEPGPEEFRRFYDAFLVRGAVHFEPDGSRRILMKSMYRLLAENLEKLGLGWLVDILRNYGTNARLKYDKKEKVVHYQLTSMSMTSIPDGYKNELHIDHKKAIAVGSYSEPQFDTGWKKVSEWITGDSSGTVRPQEEIQKKTESSIQKLGAFVDI